MAKFTLSADQHAELVRQYKRISNKFSVKYINRLFIIVALLFTLFYFNQYVLAFIIIAILAVVIWIVNFAKFKDRNFRNSRFLNSEITMDFKDNEYKVKLGLNNICLKITDISEIYELRDAYFINHSTGIHFYIPKDSLTNNEIEKIIIYKERFNS